jgi:carboxypeptidase Taq
MQEELSKLKKILKEISNLKRTISVLTWDQQTYMPPAGYEDRGDQLALLSKLTQEMSTSPDLAKVLEKLKHFQTALDPDSDEARLIQISSKDFNKAARIPVEFVVEEAKVTSMAQQAWIEARQNSDYSIFFPHLEKVVDLRRRYASFFPEADHPYDALLDDFEPGMKVSEVKVLFNEIRPKQVELIRAISNKPQVDDSFLYQQFDEKKQWDFGVEVATQFGYDWNRGRLDKAHHPFTTSFGLDDVRITTRVDPNFFNTMLFGTMHESGHALYTLGIKRALDHTGLASGASLAIHESQSRLWENLVGRSFPFWEFFYPRLQEKFPSQLGNIKLDAFYKGINKVSPSCIRVEADEATYNMHIMIRLELEIEIIEDKIPIKDLPNLWNSRMEEYLGVTPPNDAKGVLQDIHWSSGGFGYFSTYALGNLVSAQLWDKIIDDIPDLTEQIRHGKFDRLLGWLGSNIHQYGRKFEPQELVTKATGSGIQSAPYLRYLQNKYSDIYNL